MSIQKDGRPRWGAKFTLSAPYLRARRAAAAAAAAAAMAAAAQAVAQAQAQAQAQAHQYAERGSAAAAPPSCRGRRHRRRRRGRRLRLCEERGENPYEFTAIHMGSLPRCSQRRAQYILEKVSQRCFLYYYFSAVGRHTDECGNIRQLTNDNHFES
eukprot:SAG31_NODE_2593_length_5423_cov_21.402705_1_plen_156_part_00